MVISHPCDEKHFFPLGCGKETRRVMPLERLKKPRKSLPSFSASIRYGICDAHLCVIDCLNAKRHDLHTPPKAIKYSYEAMLLAIRT